MPISRSNRGNEFEFESPIPGLHIYNIDVSSSTIDKLKSMSLQREDYFVDEEYGKSSQSLWLGPDHEISLELADAFEEAIDSYFIYHEIGPKSRENWRFSKFGPGDFFGMHADDSYGTPRTCSLTYYVNDDYEGGEIEFINFGVTIKPKANQLFLFPSGYEYIHKVHKIKSGFRYNLVTFFSNMTYEEKAKRIESVGEFGTKNSTQYLLRPYK